jgi:RHS repeat-associated protein
LNQLDAQSAGGITHFTGTVSEPAAVTVNGKPAAVDTSGHFDGTVGLSPGTNTVSLVATDANGNSSTKRYQVTVPSSASRVLVYDLNGNLTQNGTRTLEWDAANRCIAINDGTHRTEMNYDGFGREAKRVEKENGTILSTKQVVWCGLQRCEERDASNSVKKRFYSQGEQINGAAYFYGRDHLGSIRELSDGNGAVRARYDYDAWGRRTGNIIVESPIEADFGFTGHYVSTQYSDLAFAPFRIYNADLGRWLSRDSLANAELLQGANLYLYVRANPVTLVDPDGREVYDSCTETYALGYDSNVRDGVIEIGGIIWVNTYPVIKRKCHFRCYHKKTTNCPRIPCLNPYCEKDHGVQIIVTINSIGNVPCALCSTILDEVTSGTLTSGSSVARNN